jgi:hypothetical protein
MGLDIHQRVTAADGASGFPHGICTTEADVINADLLAFIRG